jgi:hypothetical protein
MERGAPIERVYGLQLDGDEERYAAPARTRGRGEDDELTRRQFPEVRALRTARFDVNSGRHALCAAAPCSCAACGAQMQCPVAREDEPRCPRCTRS